MTAAGTESRLDPSCRKDRRRHAAEGQPTGVHQQRPSAVWQVRPKQAEASTPRDGDHDAMSDVRGGSSPCTDRAGVLYDRAVQTTRGQLGIKVKSQLSRGFRGLAGLVEEKALLAGMAAPTQASSGLVTSEVYAAAVDVSLPWPAESWPLGGATRPPCGISSLRPVPGGR